MIVPTQIFDLADGSMTVSNIQTKEILFRIGIAVELLSYFFYVFIPIFLYRLLHHVDEFQARLMCIFVWVSIPISMAAVGYKLNMLDLVVPTGSVNLIAEPVMDMLDAYLNLILIAQMFWGLWLFPFGYLVYRSGLLPKILGLILMIGSVGYFLDFLFRITIPDFSSLALTEYITIPASIGEIGTCLWLLIMGAKEEK